MGIVGTTRFSRIGEEKTMNDDSANDRTAQLMDEQYQQQQADIETKRRSLFSQRIAIVQSQGGMSWDAQSMAPDAGMPPVKPGRMSVKDAFNSAMAEAKNRMQQKS